MIKLTFAAISLLNISQVVQAHKVHHHSEQQNAQTIVDLSTSEHHDTLPDATPTKAHASRSHAEVNSEQSASSSGDSVGGPFTAFCIGLFLIPFTLVLIWKNEKKIVMYAKVIQLAKKSLIHDVKSAQEENQLKLVHTVGESHNAEAIKDEDFAVEAENSYRLIRKCEMNQYVEKRHEDNNKRVTYTHSLEWLEYANSSQNFQDGAGHQNPTKSTDEWPYKTDKFLGKNVQMNEYKLNDSQLERLGQQSVKSFDQESAAPSIQGTNKSMSQKEFSDFKSFGGQYLYSATGKQMVEESSMNNQVGSYRVSFKYYPCAVATIIAQQVKAPESITFRKWNPKKLDVSYETCTDAVGDTPCIDSWIFCCICKLVNMIMNVCLEEVVDGCKDGQQTFDEFFAAEDGKIKTLGRVVRPLAIFCHILGWFLLFIPLIAFLKWIPLVGWLLGGVVTVAAMVFAFVWGGTIACLVTAIAWVVFRPLFGICLLALVGVSIYLIFFLPDQLNKGKEPVKPL